MLSIDLTTFDQDANCRNRTYMYIWRQIYLLSTKYFFSNGYNILLALGAKRALGASTRALSP